MFKRIKKAFIRKIRDLYYLISKLFDKLSFMCTCEMGKAYEKGNKKEVDIWRWLYVKSTRMALKKRFIVGRCNGYLIRNK